jgi:cytochrome c2
MQFKSAIFIFAAFILAACSSASAEAIPTLNATQQQGQSVFKLRCAQCHALTKDTVVIGPSLAGIATRAESRVPGYDAQAYIERSILMPDDYLVEGFANTMPTNFGRELTAKNSPQWLPT